MSHTTIQIKCNEEEADVLSSLLMLNDYIGTSYEDGLFTAYIDEKDYDALGTRVLVEQLGLEIEQISLTEEQNWNQVWEDNFHDLKVADTIHVRAPFHKDLGMKHEIIIHPKMAFGTGHHGTTQLMMMEMLNTDHQNKKVLDMGCGSGILSILASQLGASEITAIDHDIYSVENSTENTQLNGIENVSISQADNLSGVTSSFDIILSNIVKNINISLWPEFAQHLSDSGILLVCGILIADRDEAVDAAKALNLELLQENNDGEWLQLKFQKLNDQ